MLDVELTPITAFEKAMSGETNSTRQNFRRCDDTPLGELLGKSAAPLSKPGFAVVDFLSTTDERDDDSPVRVAVHDRQHHRRFGRVPVEFFLLLLGIPGALRFIKHDNLVGRDSGRLVRILPKKCMNVLNERFNSAFRFGHRQTSSPLTVARKRSPNDSHQRSITRQEYSRRSIVASKLRIVSDRQARQCLPSSGNAGDEANDFPVILLCPGNGLYEFRGRTREIENVGVGR